MGEQQSYQTVSLFGRNTKRTIFVRGKRSFVFAIPVSSYCACCRATHWVCSLEKACSASFTN
mgnify:CR=1 FL=1